jgi:hypothetical protein
MGFCNLEEIFEIMVWKVGRRRPGEPPFARADGAVRLSSVAESPPWEREAPDSPRILCPLPAETAGARRPSRTRPKTSEQEAAPQEPAVPAWPFAILNPQKFSNLLSDGL